MKSQSVTPPRLPSGMVRADDARLLLEAEQIDRIVFDAVCCPPLDREHVSVQECTFTGCRFAEFALRHSHLSDVVFRNCDLSAADFQECSLHRVEFVDCRLTGATFAEGTFAHVSYLRCKAEYVNFTASKLRSTRFEQMLLRQAWLNDCRLERVEFVRCDLTMADFSGTRLRGVSLADSDIAAIRVRELSSFELKGLKINRMQASELARLLGVEIVE